MDEERYVSIGDGNVYLAKVDPLDAFDVELKDMIRNDEALSYDQVSQLRFEGSENYTVTYEKTSPSAWYGDDCEDLLAFTYNDLRHREVLPADFDQVTQLDISLEGKDYTITADGKGDDRVWTYQDQEIEIDDLQDALEGLSAEDAEDFLTEKATGKEEIALTVHLDDEARPEAVIRLCRCDGSQCLAVVDGAAFALVSRSDAVKLIEAVNAIVLN